MSDIFYDPYSPLLHRDPYPVYRRLRDEAPVFRNEEHDFYAITRHADVWAAFQDWGRLSSAEGITLEGLPPDIHPELITMDPPRHGELRDIVKRAFRTNHMARLFERVREIAGELVDALDPAACDLARDLSIPMPAIAIAELLGVPRADVPKFRLWSEHLVQRDLNNPPTIDRARRASQELHEFLVWHIAAQRADPKDDMLGLLVRARDEGQAMNDEELVGFARLLLVAGNETTGQLVGNMIVALAHNPGQRAEVAADPALAARAVEETLRYDSAVQALARTTLVDYPVQDVIVPAGSRLLIVIGSANRDERMFTDPDRFDIHRDPATLSRHIGFGRGIHFCLGAMLARAEGEASLQALLARFPNYRLACDEVPMVASGQVRGPTALPLAA
ncbi:cytochrome P450 [Sphingomonas bacterium]|uniref:cytochrome P450 n=1 Tax=Sphingomonas bacterium TaxID=1895847 RepID=UPI00157599CC|nr:cytochrome P450 [Sphingomonas bacterium]